VPVEASDGEVIAVKTDRVNEADPRVRRTRKLLEDAFVALLFEKGFHVLSVQDVAEWATVNRATFYAHFLDKYDLLDHVVGDWFRAALTSKVAPTAPFTPGNLQVLIITMLETLAQFHRHCHHGERDLVPLVESKAQGELKAFLSEWLRHLPPAEVEPRVSRETVATALSWTIFGAGVEWSREARGQPAEVKADEVLALLTDGLPWPAALTSARRARPRA
jgi:AcrR family transcriptional regulator